MGKHKLLSPSQQILSPKCKQVVREDYCGYKERTKESRNRNRDVHKSKQSVFPLTYCLTMTDGKPRISIVRNNRDDTAVSISSLYPNKDGSNLAGAERSDERETKKTPPLRAKVLERRRYSSSSTKSSGKLSAAHLSRKRDSETQGVEMESLLKSMEKDLREIGKFRERQAALHCGERKNDQKSTAVHDLEPVTIKKFRIKENALAEE